MKNDWRVGDMAACETFNLVEVEDGEEIYANRRWWRLVTHVGVETMSDGNDYNFIVVSNETAKIPIIIDEDLYEAYGMSTANDSVPKVGDDVVQQGNVTDASRQNLYVIAVNTASENNEAGHWIYKGIGSVLTSADTQFNLSDHIWSQETTHKVILRADEFYLTTDTGGVEELKGTTRYYLELTPSVINRSTFNGQYFTIRSWKQNGSDAPVAMTTSDGFYLSCTYTDEHGASHTISGLASGSVSYPWYAAYTYGDIILTKSGDVYDRVSFSYVENGATGQNGTSFTVKGFAQGYTEDYSSIQSGSFISYFSEGDLIIVNDGSNSGLYELHSGQWRRVTISTGDAYKQDGSDYNYYGHIFCWDGSAWLDLGQISGEDGKDAGVFTADKETIVIDETATQSGSTTTYGYLGVPSTITITGKVGTDTITPSNIAISNLTVDGTLVKNTNNNVIISGNTVTIQSSAINGGGDATKREGWVKFHCGTTVNGVSYSQDIQVNVYVNRVGTWHLQISGETAQSISEAKTWVEGQGFIQESTVIRQDSKEITISSLLNGLVRSSLNINNDNITLNADNIALTTAFINAIGAQLVAKSLVSAQSTNPNVGLRVEIENGLLVVKYNGVVRIALGLDGGNNPVLTFYDTFGNKLYDLGPEGITYIEKQDGRYVIWNTSWLCGVLNSPYVPSQTVMSQPFGYLRDCLGEHQYIVPILQETYPSTSYMANKTLYMAYLESVAGIFSYRGTAYPYTNYETGGAGTIAVEEIGDAPNPQFNRTWVWFDGAPFLWDSTPPQGFLYGNNLVVGSTWIRYTQGIQPGDYIDDIYPDGYKISDWTRNDIWYKRVALVVDGAHAASINVYKIR